MAISELSPIDYAAKPTAIEPGGIEAIPASRRHGSPWQLLGTWTAPNLEFATIFVGVIAVAFFGLGFWQAIIALAVGTALGAVTQGILSTWGPREGLAQLVLSRTAFGYRGNILPSAINTVMAGLGWFAVNSVSGAFALTTLTGMPTVLSLLIVVVIEVAVAFVGHDLVQIYERYASYILGIIFLVATVTIFLHANLDVTVKGGGLSFAGFTLTAAAAFGYAAGWNPYDETRLKCSRSGCVPHLCFAREISGPVRVLRCAGGMGIELSLSARREITKKDARAYASASKKGKGQILDRLVAEVGWSRANARRAVNAALARRGSARALKRKPRPRTYGYDTLKVLQRAWEVAGGPCGKYLAAVMGGTLANMEAHAGTGSFGQAAARFTPEVRTQLLMMSAATIDRLLAPHKRSLHPGGKSTTRSRKNRHAEVIPIMTHVAAIDWQPGLVAIDTVAHCGHTMKGQYAFTLTVTDVFTGWTINQAIKNKAGIWVAEAMENVQAQFLYPIDHVHSDNGSEFLNDPVTAWADDHGARMTRSRPGHSNDNPFAEQKNGAIVRKSAFGYRYDTDAELTLLNELWPLVNLRKNLFLPTKKVTGWHLTRNGKTVRTYDAPATPADRVVASGILLPPDRERLSVLRENIDLADLTDHITRIQHRLIALAEAKTYAQAPQAA